VAARKKKLPDDKLDQGADDGTAEQFDLAAPNPDVPTNEGRDRKALVNAAPLNPLSLSGSWFIKVQTDEDGIDEAVWFGVVVADVGTVSDPAYLLQIEQGKGLANPQIPVPLEELYPDPESKTEFRFFDSEELMRAGSVGLAGRACPSREEVEADD